MTERTTWMAGAVFAFLAVALVLGVMAAASGTLLIPAAVALGAVLLAALVKPELATVAFMAGLYLNLPAVLSKFHGVPYAVSGAILLLLVIPLAALLMRRVSPVFTPALPWMLMYFAVILISSALSRDPFSSLGWVGIFLSEGLLLYLLVTNVVRTPATLRHVVWALVAAGALMGGISLHQQLTGNHDSNYLGLSQVYGRGITVETAAGEERQPRAAGPIGEKNRYAQVLLILFPLALSRLVSESRAALRVLGGAASFLINLRNNYGRMEQCHLSTREGESLVFLPSWWRVPTHSPQLLSSTRRSATGRCPVRTG
jgi:putative inorganic carbon (hco3(-)) transporter